MISRDDVVNGYRMVLGREPESEDIIERQSRHDNLHKFREALFQSPEFKAKRRDILVGQHLAPAHPTSRLSAPLSNCQK